LYFPSSLLRSLSSVGAAAAGVMGLDPGTTGVIINLVVGGVITTLAVVIFDFWLRKRLPTVFEYRKYLQYVI